jgi:hypothetical protein
MTILVPGNYPTIQSAINAANNGDTVLVSPGTYVENISFNGKAITVTSSNGPATTIIDGNHNGTVVTFNHSETAASVLSGFTIRNGYQNGGFGAGITITAASPTISSNVITSNHAATGIGIFVNGGAPLIQHNTISNNDQAGAGSGGSGGGGILVFGVSPGIVQIIGNTISNNSLQSGGQGGGVSFNGGSALLQGNLISGNLVYNDGGGISAYNTYSPLTIVENVIIHNTAQSGEGGGINLSLPSTSAAVFVTNNTIVANFGSANTSGVYTTGFAQPATFTNNIIVATPGQTAVSCNTTYSSTSPGFSYNDVFSPTGTAWTSACDSTSNPGNISADPLFLNPSVNDFHLALASPAVDAGNNTASSLPPADLDGNPRVADGNNDGAAVIDLGAFELTPTSAATLTPSDLTFATLPVGSSSAAQTATFTATGVTPSQITSVQISGDFAQTSNCPQFQAPLSSQSLLSGGSCIFNVVFTPTTPGARGGFLAVNQTNGTTLTVPLSGIGATAPMGSLSPSSLTFADGVGGAGVTKAVTLSNVGNAPLNLTSIATIGAAFSQTNTCGTSLAPGASCAINVTFAASAVSTYTGELDIQDATDNLSYVVSLTGTAVDFSIVPSISSLSLSPGSAVQEIIAVKSSGGNYPYTVSLSCSGLPSNISCTFGPATAIVGTAPTLTISSQTQVTVGSFPITIIGVSGNGTVHSAQIQLTVKPSIVLSTTSLSFPNQPYGNASVASPVTLTNNSTGNFSISSIWSSGYFLQTNNCQSSLPPGGYCTVSVSFAPQNYGPLAGTLNIQDNVDNLSYSVALSGNGLDFSLALSSNSAALLAGSASQIPVTVNALGGAYTSSVSLSCAGLPANTACSFSPVTAQPAFNSFTSTMTISSQALATGGTYPVTVTAVSSFGRTQIAQLQLTTLKPSLSRSVSMLSFVAQPVGSTSTASIVILTNNSPGPFNFSSLFVSGAFAQTNNCPSVLPVNSSCSVNVLFRPAASGPTSGVLSIQDNVDGLSYTVPLSGAGVDFSVSAAPASVSVIRGNSAAFIVSLAPLGGAYSSSVAFSCSGLPAGAVCSFSSQNAVPGSSGATVSLNVTTDQHATPLGTATVTLVGSSTAATHSVQIQLTVAKNKNN